MKKILLSLSCLVFILSTAVANNQKNDPWVQWRKGYELFLEGDKFMRRNQLEEALSAYKRSRDTYRLVLEANTGWNQNLINSKISACETQILKIEKRLRASGKKVTVSIPSSPTTSSYSQPSSPSRPASGDDEYKKKYFNLYIEVENLRKQLRTQAQTAKNIDVLLKEKRIAEEKVSALQRNIENLRQQIVQPEKELKNIQKQLIAERMKNEQLVIARSSDTASIKDLQKEIKNLNSELTSIQNKLKDSNSARESLNDTIETLKDKIKDLNNDRNDLKKEISKYTDEIKSIEKSYADSKNEIKKLNNWIDELNRKKGANEKLASDIVKENRNIKNENSSLQDKIRNLEKSAEKTLSELEKSRREHDAVTQNLNTLALQKKSIESELQRTRDLYLKQLNAEKLNKAELNTLRNANKKNVESLQTYISRNAELTAMLETKDSASANYSRKIENLQKDIDAKNKEIANLNNILKNADISNTAKKLAELTRSCNQLESANKELKINAEKLENNNNALAAELKSLKSELQIARTTRTSSAAAPLTQAKNVVSAPDNSEYNKLLAQYKDLKSKYDFLSAEIESLNKPLADVETQEPEISSDKELAKFLLQAATDASKANDFISAAWYFSELKKQDAKNPLYIFGHALYSTAGADRANAEKIISALDNCREKFVLYGLLAMLDGKNKLASANFDRAEDEKSVSAEVLNLYRKELPVFIKMFDKTESMQSNIASLKELLK